MLLTLLNLSAPVASDVSRNRGSFGSVIEICDTVRIGTTIATIRDDGMLHVHRAHKIDGIMIYWKGWGSVVSIVSKKVFNL